jgi:hypothetical protein
MPDRRSCSMQMCRFHRMPLGGFYRIVDAAYERRAMAVSTNLHPSGFDGIMPKTLATATVDRLLHHAMLSPPAERKAAADDFAGSAGHR